MPFYEGNNNVATENEELIQRLRELEWPSVSPELRKRCWEDFSRRLENGRGPALVQGSRRATGERYAFSRRPLSVTGGQSPVAGSRMAIAAELTRNARRPRLIAA